MDIRARTSFKCIKYSLVTIIFLQFLISIFVAIYWNYYIDIYSSYYGYYNGSEPSNSSYIIDGTHGTDTNYFNFELIRGLVIAIIVIFDIILAIGFVGILRESYALTLAYAIFLAISLLINVTMYIRSYRYLHSLLFELVVVFTAFHFAHLLRKSQQQQFNVHAIGRMPEEMVVVSSQPPPYQEKMGNEKSFDNPLYETEKK